MRLRSYHPGVTVDDIVAATGFALTIPDDVAETRLPDARGARPPPRRARPRLAARPRGADADRSAGSPHHRRHPALHTELCERLGVRYPIVQTGMGWVAGPRLVAATAEAGGLGILASATMTPRRAGGGHRRGARPHHGPLRRQPAHRRGRRGRAHRADDRDRRPGGQLRPGAQPGPGDPLQGGRAVRHAHGRRPAPRREGGRMGRRRRHRPGRRGRRAHRDASPRRSCCPRWSTPWATASWSSAPAASSAGAAWWPRWPTAPPASPWAPASCSRPRAGCPTPSRRCTSRRRSPAPWSPPRSTARPNVSCAPTWSTTWSHSRGCAPCRARCAAPTGSARRRAPPSPRCCARGAP